MSIFCLIYIGRSGSLTLSCITLVCVLVGLGGVIYFSSYTIDNNEEYVAAEYSLDASGGQYITRTNKNGTEYISYSRIEKEPSGREYSTYQRTEASKIRIYTSDTEAPVEKQHWIKKCKGNIFNPQDIYCWEQEELEYIEIVIPSK